MEDDYKLVENEGLFQEYLEMGKHVFLQLPVEVIWIKENMPLIFVSIIISVIKVQIAN